MEQTFTAVYIVDAFTNELFSGNPAAVCCLEKDFSDSLKRKIAAEMNLSETAFVTIENGETFEKSPKFGLRWFTPTHEVDLCGHATLAAAAIIFHKLGNKEKAIEFNTHSGILKAIQEKDSSITLDFPLNPPSPYQAQNLKDIIRVVAENLEIQDVQHSSTTKKLLLRLADKYKRHDLENLNPSTQELLSYESNGVVKGVIITLQGDANEGYDFYSRYFAPWVGIPEDPVTGSAHTVLAAYWQKVYNKDQFRARQCSKRGGDLNIKIIGQRVKLTGEVAHVLEGKIRIKL
uniref:Phenazine biosynthesis-like domain-containing protein n=1 Tax=Daphnia galeata TaxID=27404 RepID=A0A8J2WW08_9CRUS|nr:unnamed protein product [Daphnia galeata]